MTSTLIFTLNTAAGERIERTYSGTIAEKAAAFRAEFPFGSGVTVSHTTAVEEIEALVEYGRLAQGC